MLELVAEGPQVDQRWKKKLLDGKTSVLGRELSVDFPTPWDPHISRKHVNLTSSVEESQLHVIRHENASNSIWYDGQEVDECYLKPGDCFVIGSTTFRLVTVRSETDSPVGLPFREHTYSQKQLKSIHFSDADKRIDVLSHLPKVINHARTDDELFESLVSVLLVGLIRADAVAIVRIPTNSDESVEILNWDRRRETSGDFHPSKRLIAEAIQKQKQSTLHIWNPDDSQTADYTVAQELDWAVCTPLPGSHNEGWGIYFAGRWNLADGLELNENHETTLINSDVKFAEIVAEIVSSVRKLSQLERQQSSLRQFLSPPILAALGDDLDSHLLDPRECDVAVLFCDLRGFTQKAEQQQNDLLGLLDRVSKALELMTKEILDLGGVIGDFHGDAALGFWGWPLASSEAPLNACKAALRIQSAFKKLEGQSGHPLADFKTGIGIACGRSVAGKIGTSDQVKITVFGPVVNLASRLEGMTKQLRVPILIDSNTVEGIAGKLTPQVARLRKLARVVPFGMETPVDVHEILAPEDQGSDLTNEHLKKYELGVNQFIEGNWESAYQNIHSMPSSDRAQDFLNMIIAKNNRTAPEDWEGVIHLTEK